MTMPSFATHTGCHHPNPPSGKPAVLALSPEPEVPQQGQRGRVGAWAHRLKVLPQPQCRLFLVASE